MGQVAARGSNPPTAVGGLTGCFLLTLCALGLGVSSGLSSDEPRRLDPAAWGSDHVGKPVPEYATGEECLFCHRDKIGARWSANRHNLTIRPADEPLAALTALKQSDARAFADDVKLVMGNQERQRFLRPTREYGKLELLSVEWAPPRDEKPGRLIAVERPHWNGRRFADSCAGCHTTAVDPEEKAFAAISLDCFTCHGTVPAEHAKTPALAYLSPKRKDDARVITSICAQCHVRNGKSKGTGRPYPTNFVAGDNLFRDFQVEFSDQALKSLGTADRHVLENVRDVVVFGREAVTCLSCHDIHGRSSKKHHKITESSNCQTCHNAEGSKRVLKPFSNSSKTCGY